MRLITFVTIVVLLSPPIYCQIELTLEEMDKLKSEIETETITLRQKLDNDEYISEFNKLITIEFTIDTFKIQTLFSKRLEQNYTTTGMVNACVDLEKEYDSLLNKYYAILLGKLSKSDQDILRKSQRNWIQFRDSERQLSSEISKDEYSGGGTIQNIIVADYYVSITKKRVLELNGYLQRIIE